MKRIGHMLSQLRSPSPTDAYLQLIHYDRQERGELENHMDINIAHSNSFVFFIYVSTFLLLFL